MSQKPWTKSMPAGQFERMREILMAPSPVGLEGAMTKGVLKPLFESFKPSTWGIHTFRGNAGIVLDSHPGEDDRFSVMIVGHADKIRLQVRSIDDEGKIWVNSDSFLPTTLLGHEVILFSENPDEPGSYRRLDGGTIEAVGAIHFATQQLRQGKVGLRPEQLYLELQVHGEKKKQQVLDLGIRPGDPILLNRPIKHGFSPDTFYGAYLDNGLGSFVTAEVARIAVERGLCKNIRLLAAVAAYEEIGRLGSRVLAGVFKPDVIIAADVSHDYVAAPGVKEKRFSPTAMGKGFTLAFGSIANPLLNTMYQRVAREHDIPLQVKVVGRDTGTDAMAAVFASIDAAATSIGFPIRNMHTISEAGHTGDVLAAIHATVELLAHMDAYHDGSGIRADDFREGHPRLDDAAQLTWSNTPKSSD